MPGLSLAACAVPGLTAVCVLAAGTCPRLRARTWPVPRLAAGTETVVGARATAGPLLAARAVPALGSRTWPLLRTRRLTLPGPATRVMSSRSGRTSARRSVVAWTITRRRPRCPPLPGLTPGARPVPVAGPLPLAGSRSVAARAVPVLTSGIGPLLRARALVLPLLAAGGVPALGGRACPLLRTRRLTLPGPATRVVPFRRRGTRPLLRTRRVPLPLLFARAVSSVRRWTAPLPRPGLGT
jgi:hypothetical protein